MRPSGGTYRNRPLSWKPLRFISVGTGSDLRDAYVRSKTWAADAAT
jgi:hypothetical protein